MALFVEYLVEHNGLAAVDFWRGASLDPFGLESVPEGVTVIALVGDQRLGFRKPWIKQLCADVIAHLALREQQHDRLAITIRDGMEFGVQAAFRAPDTAGNIPFLSRLAAVRWAFG